ncbi:methyltransferase domain-containing protein [Streptomyces sp. NPDC048392]|uniref:methyltransferase domain-containing protein n=1 Tax=Streptomyces sp. NPDC048392 TaxID=3365543 RepID=UPI00372331C9
MSTDAARRYMAGLTAELEHAGAIRSRAWSRAFAATPRHVLVPSWLEQETNERGIAVWRQRQASDEVGLAAVYRDVTLVTALDPATADQVDTGAWTGIPTSSSTQPSLMAGMLESLDVADGQRVLEIGAGTGYNAALLSARLGDRAVYSVDVDQALVDAARERLAAVGHHPRLTASDGTHGYPDAGTVDRIIATCSVPAVPDAWLDQLRPGGIIVTDIALGIEGGLVRLSRRDDGSARGVFTAASGRFMPARREASTYPARRRPERASTAGTRPTSLTAAVSKDVFGLQSTEVFWLHGWAGGGVRRCDSRPCSKVIWPHFDRVVPLALEVGSRGGLGASVSLPSACPRQVRGGCRPGSTQTVDRPVSAVAGRERALVRPALGPGGRTRNGCGRPPSGGRPQLSARVSGSAVANPQLGGACAGTRPGWS